MLFDGVDEVPELLLNEGDAASLNALITPFRARNGYHLEYKSSDSTVAKVDSTGAVTAVGGGEAEITVSVVKDASAIIVGSDFTSNATADERGIISVNEGEEQVVMTKTVPVTVKSASSPDVPQTNDAALPLSAVIMALSVCGIIAAARAGRKKKVTDR